jgi:hypothetical protein
LKPPASPEDNQRGLDRRHAMELEWARWAVDRWAGFPVDRLPRPLVLTAPAPRVEGGFRSGEAKLAFVTGLVDSIVPVPDAVLAALRDRPGGGPVPPRGTKPLVIVRALRSQAVLAPDGQTLTFSFVGALPQIVEYAGADAVESDQAVAVVPLATYVGPPASIHTAVGWQREVQVRLGRPLGARVLVDLDSTPGDVREVSQPAAAPCQGCKTTAGT